jgi:hypothetical protein
MKKILDGQTRRIGAIFNEIDVNFIAVANSILRIAYPGYTLLGYAVNQPASSVQGDCYLVQEDDTVWGIECEKDHILYYNGTGFEVLEWKITEINQKLQNLWFTASQTTIAPIEGLYATNVQESLAVITAALVANGLMTPFVAYIGTMSIGDTFVVN